MGNSRRLAAAFAVGVLWCIGAYAQGPEPSLLQFSARESSGNIEPLTSPRPATGPPRAEGRDGAAAPQPPPPPQPQVTATANRPPASRAPANQAQSSQTSSDEWIGLVFFGIVLWWLGHRWIVGRLRPNPTVRNNAGERQRWAPAPARPPRATRRAASNQIRFSPVEVAPSQGTGTLALGDLRDAVTGRVLDPKGDLFQCTVCRSYYHADSAAYLNRENGGLCAGCGRSGVTPLAASRGQSRRDDEAEMATRLSSGTAR